MTYKRIKFTKEAKEQILDDYRDYMKGSLPPKEIERRIEEYKKDPDGYMKLWGLGCGR